ncbi:protein-glutamate O-methyltransferase CheR [Gemmata sp. G18]|uniref:protein-glutamate O-methyltransferase n=1 Tax=Gemmata palustris TaxID=2822762 RepID=A0ABS5BMA3_9BACT|nr:protein-glutamate O-methyltransferase CheR [Gemmata palustris]MBP3954410.1 protein-glutamate O-methyltransferase CheR [Gemmata palustris]
MLPLPQVTFDRLAQLIYGLCGLVLTNDKAYLIHHRLEPIVTQSGLRDYDELCDRLRSPTLSPLHEQVIEAITTHETSFFRDGQSFEALRQVLLPELVEAAGQRKRALGVRPHGRIWCAGASTGEEAYSVAILLDELVQGRPRRDLGLGDFAFLATDISPGVLDVARAGVYSDRNVARVRSPYLRRYFKQQLNDWQVVEPLRRFIDFRRANLLDGTPSAGLFDLVLCRNVLIYFDEETRRRICRRFHAVVRPGGALVLGAAENLYGVSEGFTSEQHGSAFFYRKGVSD